MQLKNSSWLTIQGSELSRPRPKIVQMVLIGCISMSRGHKICLHNAIFKNLLVWNYKAQSFHVWYIVSSRCPLPKFLKLCLWGQYWPRPWVTILHWIIQGKLKTTSSLETLLGIWPNSKGMIPGLSRIKIVQMVLIGCISRSRGKKLGFQNAFFQKSSCLKPHGSELSYLAYKTI